MQPSAVLKTAFRSKPIDKRISTSSLESTVLEEQLDVAPLAVAVPTSVIVGFIYLLIILILS